MTSTHAAQLLHNRAMDKASDALVMRKMLGDERAARALSREALALELEAARAWPSWDWWKAVLYRSAATCALDAGMPDEAIRIVHQGMICLDDPLIPSWIAEELFEVLERAAPDPK